MMTTEWHGIFYSIYFFSFPLTCYRKTTKNVFQENWPAIGETPSVWFINKCKFKWALIIMNNFWRITECMCNITQLLFNIRSQLSHQINNKSSMSKMSENLDLKSAWFLILFLGWSVNVFLQIFFTDHIQKGP